ncbi:hypothetical protein SERLA73DRAFT_76453 [Serpula lacrymans var. lacrymans S7.3]|uniref:Endonuclease/exonuclease/phosphatase domain-containing protein n=2 Tax=Serpula lacrymans var. lacrymans TaxID=341189 RepID=F8Q707_SERL3|nr:uncharacterized protein SERLADRAFT_441269 [Serpula lacrymans var. lacrymans S7.9]EGN95345.1 hypothetical protein SERLA73DRAFT_76453 [Serpula lacrymans var. lacrymans S7.3]EGO20880.1 hypothetical protein SERLADRAFT_441269 [Serpula lacrymans var. lacrymans S7.9]
MSGTGTRLLPTFWLNASWGNRLIMKLDLMSAPSNEVLVANDTVVGDVERAENNKAYRRYAHNHPTKELATPTDLGACAQFIIFNTKSMSVRKTWHELRTTLGDEFCAAVAKIKHVTHLNCHPRMDMWLRGDIGGTFARLLRARTKYRTHGFREQLIETLTKTNPDMAPKAIGLRVMSSWRIAVWQPWQDWEPPEKAPKVSPRPVNSGILTLNINGFQKKKELVQDVLQTNRIAVCALQETLVAPTHFPLRIDGYNSFVSPWVEGFRGQALLIDLSLPAYEIPRAKPDTPSGGRYVIHVKVSGLRDIKRPVHFLAAYLPSGGNFRLERKFALQSIVDRFDHILEKDPGALVVCLGDLNIDHETLDRRLKRKTNNVIRLPPVGSPLSRFPIWGTAKAIDHILASPQAYNLLRKPRVIRSDCISDHRPLISHIRSSKYEHRILPAKVWRTDAKMIRRFSEQIANDNCWGVFQDMEITEYAELSEAAVLFSKVTHQVTTHFGVKTQSGYQKTKLPRKLKNLQKKCARYGKEVAKEQEEVLSASPRIGVSELLITKHKRAKTQLNKAKKEWQRREKEKLYSQISDDYVAHDHKNVWSRLRAQVDTKLRGNNLQPVHNKAGELKVDMEGIFDAIAEHYRALAHDDPNGISQNPEHWDVWHK